MHTRFAVRRPHSFARWGRRFAATAFFITLGVVHVASAQEKHVHGTVKLNVALEGNKLTVELEAPLDSLLGFEHSPRTDAQRRAADALLQQMKNAQVVATPDAAAQCTVTSTNVSSEALTTSKKEGGKKEAHSDLDATYEFTCAQPQNLRALTVGLFDAFKRIKRIDARFVGAQSQRGRTLTPGSKTLQLVR